MRRRLLIALLAVFAAPRAACAHVVSDREVRVLAQLPAGFVAQALAAFVPDSLGFVPPNASGQWLDVTHQRPALLILMDAAAHADSIGAERAWRAMDPAWVAQRADGGFDRAHNSAADSGAAALIGEAAWAAAVARAQIAIANSALADRFMWRHALMLPKFKHAVNYLEARAAKLVAADSSDAGYLLVAAAAFLLADGMFHEIRYGRAGQQALSRALVLQRSDGMLPANGRADLAHQTLGLESLQSIAIYFPSPTLDNAARRAAEWLRKHANRSQLERLTREAALDGSPRVSAGEAEFVLHYAAITPPPPLKEGTVEPEH